MAATRNKAFCRSQNRIHARRKRKISREVYGCDWYNNLHQYSKNKVHCSCWMCRFHGPSHSEMMKMEKAKSSLQSSMNIKEDNEESTLQKF